MALRCACPLGFNKMEQMIFTERRNKKKDKRIENKKYPYKKGGRTRCNKKLQEGDY